MLCALPVAAWSLSPAAEQAERHYQAGIQMLEHSHFKDARTELEVAAQLAPERADIKDALRGAAEAKGVPAGLSATPAVSEKAAPSAEARKKAQPILAEANSAYRASQLSQAADAWQRALLVDKDN